MSPDAATPTTAISAATATPPQSCDGTSPFPPDGSVPSRHGVDRGQIDLLKLTGAFMTTALQPPLPSHPVL
ncbi:hypothetical protein, partial [Streptomyces scabichelini]|uniref:hypothetical protein n=1 Tax=Streptomyces scabichelini TaxID=2711217 RepID=UPI003B96BCAD